LRKGTHTLVLSNHSDHIAIQKILFTNSVTITPEDFSLVFSDIFYDGFDGCDQGNFENWDVLCGQWLVLNPDEQICFEENVLIGRSEESSFIIYKNDDWTNYSFNVEIKPVVFEDIGGSIGICLGVKDVNQYYQLKFCRTKKPDTAKAQVIEQVADKAQALADFEVPFEPEQWHQVQISLGSGNITIKVDDAKLIETSVSDEIKGGIGFRLQGNVEAYFDDVHVSRIIDIEN
jgi:hypothetical protein